MPKRLACQEHTRSSDESEGKGMTPTQSVDKGAISMTDGVLLLVFTHTHAEQG
ncbi:MAG: hypothetical protein AAGK78_07680 [Planctomycetota bacterium]